jgi:hypothetical protein
MNPNQHAGCLPLKANGSALNAVYHFLLIGLDTHPKPVLRKKLSLI